MWNKMNVFPKIGAYLKVLGFILGHNVEMGILGANNYIKLSVLT